MLRSLRNVLVLPLALAPALALAVVVVAAPSARAAASSAHAAPAGSGDLVRETIVDGPADLVWKLITTKKGVESWLVPHADIDLKVGGRLRTHQSEDGKIGDANTLVTTILALEPRRLLGIRVDRTPKDSPMARFLAGTRYDILVDPVDGHRTRVRCIGRGLGSGATGYALRPFFDKGADAAFEELEKAVAARAPKSGKK